MSRISVIKNSLLFVSTFTYLTRTLHCLFFNVQVCLFRHFICSLIESFYILPHFLWFVKNFFLIFLKNFFLSFAILDTLSLTAWLFYHTILSLSILFSKKIYLFLASPFYNTIYCICDYINHNILYLIRIIFFEFILKYISFFYIYTSFHRTFFSKSHRPLWWFSSYYINISVIKHTLFPLHTWIFFYYFI